MSQLKGSVALVTGGARGIGRATVLELASRSADVVVSDINLEGAEKTAKEAEAFGVKAMAVAGDVSNSEDVAEMVAKATEKFGKIDILVNNAGITKDNLLMRLTEQDWDLVLKVNLKGAYLCTKAVLRAMMKNRKGKIINVASVVGVMGNAGQSNYAASKAGLIGFTKSVAKEVGSRNIQANCIAPGYIETEMTDHLAEDVKEAFLNSIPLKRGGKPEDVAKVVAFLASSDSDYITGQVINIDGGMLT
ncbi:MAG: 3-oxoacyl-[acyl-carrier-protein] reductase [Clostridiales bacterium]|nr:3-oxoacyl-[acyl-carrier-protein] reductase [Clostridiales bacterium]